MPIYEYVCSRCRHAFEVIVRAAERPACPSCGGRRLEKQPSVFAAGPTDAGRTDVPTGPCTRCGDPRGPGSCALD